MGSSNNPRRPMEWQASLGGMVAQGVLVHRVYTARGCGRGGTNIDLRPMLEREGPNATLWDRRPMCPHCEERGHYMASPGPGTVYRPLLSDEAWQNARYQLQKALGLTKRDRRRIAAFAEKVDSARPDAKGLSDLDVAIFVTARRMVVDPIPAPYVAFGGWKGRDLLFREFNAGERDVWERRPRGPRPV